jgi:hypothetical protein
VGNTELWKNLGECDKIDSKNVFSRLRKGHSSGCSIEKEIEFAASHRCELDLEDAQDLDISIAERIVSSAEWRLNSDDSLLQFIYKIDCATPILIRRVFVEWLSLEGISACLDCLPAPVVDSLIWSSLCRRLVPPV